MPTIAIITDSDSSLPQQFAAQYNIRQVPITIHFDNENFTTGVDIDDRLLFERIDQTGKLPTTAAPAPSAFAAAYRAAFDEGADAVVCICVSSIISATYNSAISACEEFPGKSITVVDSLNVSMGQGFIVLAAGEAAKAGASIDEIVQIAHSTSKRIRIFGSLSTLKYLAMGGRVGKLSAGMATILHIRPILTSNEGKLDLLERVRTHKTAMKRLVELVQESVRDNSIEKAAIIHVNNLPDAAELESRLRAHIALPDDVPQVEFSPGLSVHTGSGMVGIAILLKE